MNIAEEAYTLFFGFILIGTSPALVVLAVWLYLNYPQFQPVGFIALSATLFISTAIIAFYNKQYSYRDTREEKKIVKEIRKRHFKITLCFTSIIAIYALAVGYISVFCYLFVLMSLAKGGVWLAIENKVGETRKGKYHTF